MTKCLLMTTRGFNSNYASLYKQMNILKDKEVTLLHKYKTERVVDYVQNTAQIKLSNVINLHDQYKEVIQLKYNTWEEFYNSFSLEEKFDEIWLFGAPLSDGARLKRRWPNTYDKVFNTSAYMKFVSIASLFFDMYSLVKIANDSNCEINELCYDPGEASLSNFSKSPKVNTYHGYDIDHLKIKRIDSFQQGLNLIPLDIHEKSIDFCLGYSYMNSEREDVHNKVQQIYEKIYKKYTKKLYLKSKMTEVYDDIKYDDYLIEIKKSRFTLMLPPYQDKCFSPYRFIEAVHNDCLPFIMDDCYVDEFQYSFDIHPVMIDSLRVNEKNINKKLAEFNEETRMGYITILKEKLNLR